MVVEGLIEDRWSFCLNQKLKVYFDKEDKQFVRPLTHWYTMFDRHTQAESLTKIFPLKDE
jgi:hypothetical protein